MSLDLMIITNNSAIAKEAEEAGVERIFLDFELRGKKERQGGLDTHITDHSFEDIKKIKNHIVQADILTRINPIYENTENEIKKAIDFGTDIIMLPMFKKVNEVEKFIKLVDGQVKTSLLMETAAAMVRARKICQIDEIDEIHIGLNDMHLSMDLDFMFEVLSGGIVEYLSNIFKENNIRWGFGGIAKISEGDLPAEHILAEHIRLGSQMVILSRTFLERSKTVEELRDANFKKEVQKLRKKEKEIKNWSQEEFIHNKKVVANKVNKIVNKIRGE